MTPAPRQHGVKGVYYGGEWLDIEDCATKFSVDESKCSGSACQFADACPRSRSRVILETDVYDVLIIGAGCVGATMARELSRYDLNVLWVDAADDVTQGATKGNSGIVHAGYDDTPNTNRAKYCWKGNQMFAQLDRELRFGYQTNGSLVVAMDDKETKHLQILLKRGQTNGVKNLRIVQQQELREMEPHINPKAVAALYSPDAGNVIPYEFTIALAENAVDNGVELRIRRQVEEIKQDAKIFKVKLNHWEPDYYMQAIRKSGKGSTYNLVFKFVGGVIFLHYLAGRTGFLPPRDNGRLHMMAMAWIWVLIRVMDRFGWGKEAVVTKSTPLVELAKKAGKPVGQREKNVEVADMLVGGSGSGTAQDGKVISKEIIQCRYIVNCAGGGSDQIAAMIGDTSFKIKPRLGDYILLNRNQGHLAKHTLFPCPDPVLGKGVLVQTTLWGNLILGPTARDVYKPEARDMSAAAIQEYILSKCKKLVPSFDAKETIHAFCGARAKSDRGDWIIEPSKQNGNLIHVAGIDSPGLAGAPAVALDVVKLLQKAGLRMRKDPKFNPNRAPIITPKDGMKGLKMGPVGKFDSDGSNTEQMAKNVVCKCEKVTELEIVRALRRSLPIDSSQGIRKRTRAGMGHCQGDPENYGCEARVRAIIARENGVPVDQVGGRPFPATSTLTERWIGDKEKQDLAARMQKA